jgi:hypothetical protein
MNKFRARTGLRTTASLVASLGLMTVLAMPALANHEDDFQLVAVATGEGTECGDFDFAFKLDSIDQLNAGIFTASDKEHTVWIQIELFESEEGEVNDFVILDADPTIDDTNVKQPNEGGGISHITFCFDTVTATPTPEVTPTPEESASAATPTPTPTPEESDSAATPTARENELGGNPSPAPSGGTLPNTALMAGESVNAIVLTLVLIGSLAALASLRLARQR